MLWLGELAFFCALRARPARHGDRDGRQIRSNPRGFVVKRVPRYADDWLYILAAYGCEYLIKECLHGRRSVNPLAARRLGAVAESG